VFDAVAWMKKNYNIDDKRIYLTGSSGGGHMTLQMVGNHPELWAAASAWVGISDLRASPALARKLIGWSARQHWTGGIDRTVTQLRKQPASESAAA